VLAHPIFLLHFAGYGIYIDSGGGRRFLYYSTKFSPLYVKMYVIYNVNIMTKHRTFNFFLHCFAGYLIHIDCSGEREFLYDVIDNKQHYIQWWTGGTRNEQDEWMWVDADGM
jgi:hypothetical protein